MAVLATTNPTLTDLAKLLDPNGQIATVVEILSQTNEVLDDMPWMEGNLPTGMRHTIRTGLPTPTWRKLYAGVQPTKGENAQVTDNCGMLEAYAEVDKALADLSGNVAAFRLNGDKAHIEAMSQEVAQTIFYGNEGTAPAEFTGLAPRFNTRLATTAASGDNVIHGGGSGSDNTSIWLVGWGDNQVCGIYPKGSKAGLSITDKGQVTVENVDGSNGRAEMYRTHFRWDCGLAVKDWRYIVRIANVDISDLTKDAASGGDLVDLMTQAVELLPSLSNCRPVFYGNRTVRSFLRRQIKNAKNINLTLEQVAGKHVMMFDGIPFRRCDQLLNTEAAVPNS